MKMVKKILIGAVAVAAMAMTGCKVNLGLGELKGSKYAKELTIDATKDNKDVCESLYRRYFGQISDKTHVPGKFKMDISVNPENLGNSTIGVAFDVNELKYVATDKENGDVYKVAGNKVTDEDGNDIVIQDGEKVFDFVLVGFKAATGKFYIEHYVNVPKAVLKEGMDTNFGAMGNYYAFTKGADMKSTSESNKNLSNDYFDVAGAVTTNEEGWKQFTITVDQEVQEGDEPATGKYTIKIGGTKVGTYTSGNNIKEKSDLTVNSKQQWMEVGGVFAYGNAFKGNKVEAKYVTSDAEYKYTAKTNEFALMVAEDAE